MGEWKVQVPVRLDPHIVERMERDVKRFLPFCEGRSTLARVLIQIAYTQIDSGAVDWTLEGIQKALGIEQVSGVRTMSKKA